MHFWCDRNWLLGTSNHKCLCSTPARKSKSYRILSMSHQKQGFTLIIGNGKLLISIPSAAKVMSLLYKVLSKEGAKRQMEWDNTMTSAFQSTKHTPTQTTMMSHPHMLVWTALTVNTSQTVIGFVLKQHINGKWQMLIFFSQQLWPHWTVLLTENY